MILTWNGWVETLTPVDAGVSVMNYLCQVFNFPNTSQRPEFSWDECIFLSVGGLEQAGGGGSVGGADCQEVIYTNCLIVHHYHKWAVLCVFVSWPSNYNWNISQFNLARLHNYTDYLLSVVLISCFHSLSHNVESLRAAFWDETCATDKKSFTMF